MANEQIDSSSEMKGCIMCNPCTYFPACDPIKEGIAKEKKENRLKQQEMEIKQLQEVKEEVEKLEKVLDHKRKRIERKKERQIRREEQARNMKLKEELEVFKQMEEAIKRESEAATGGESPEMAKEEVGKKIEINADEEESEDYDKEAEIYDKYYIEHYLNKPKFTSLASVLSSSSTSSESEEVKEPPKLEKYPFTKHSKAVKSYVQRQKHAWTKCQVKSELEKKLKDLCTLQENLEHQKHISQCHREEHLRRDIIHNEKILGKLKKEYNIDVQNLPVASKFAIERYKKEQQERTNKKIKQMTNRIDILKRILNEKKKEEAIKVVPQRVPKKAQKPDKVIEILPSVEQLPELSSVEQLTEQPAAEDQQVKEQPDQLSTDAEEQVEPEEKESPHKKVKGKKDKGKKDKGKGKGEKEKKEKKEKKGKKDKKEGSKEKKAAGKKSDDKKKKKGKGKGKDDEKEEPEPPPPPPPKREHIQAENILFPELMESFQSLEELDMERKALKAPPPSIVAAETAFSWKPQAIIFKVPAFRPGQSFQQHVRVTNQSLNWVNCRLADFELDDDLLLSEFKMLIPSCKVYPGMNFEFTVTFEPMKATNSILGELIFETNRGPGSPTQSFRIPVECYQKRPESPEPAVSPLEVNFPPVRGWIDVAYQTIKLINKGNVGCTANIQKIGQPEEEIVLEEPVLQLPEVSSPESPEEVNTQTTEQKDSGYDDDDEKTENGTSIIHTRKSATKKGKKKKSGSIKHAKMSVVEVPADPIPLQDEEKEADTIKSQTSGQVMAQEIIEDSFKEVFEVFRFEQKHFIDIPPRSFVPVRIKFTSQAPGLYYEEFNVQFEDYDGNSVGETIIPVTGEIIPFPLTVDPMAIDLQLCALEEEYRCSFSVHNNSRYVVAVTPKLPLSLRSHGKIVPSHEYSRPGSSAIFVLEFKPKRSLPLDAAKNKYFDPETEILDFPLSIHCTCSLLGQCPVLKIQILAVVTDPYEIELNPRICNFGIVTTLETVVHCVTLTNNSKTIQHYCFTNIPDCVVIQPDCGKGKLSPGEDKELKICYSPQLKHIKGNELVQRSGISGEHCFILYCVTAASADKLIQAKKNKELKAVISLDTKELEKLGEEMETEPELEPTNQHEANASLVEELELKEPESVDQAETNEVNIKELQEHEETQLEVVDQTKEPQLEVVDQPKEPQLEVVDQPKEPQLEVVDHPKEPQLEVVDQHENLEENSEEHRAHEESTLETNSQTENRISSIKSSKRSVSFKRRITELLPSPSFIEAQNFINNYTITGYDSDSEKSCVVQEVDLYKNPVKLNDLQLKDREVPKNIIECYAYVMDPHCELSKYRVKFPMTPCGSFSSVNLFLYGENKSTEPDCRCGVLPAMGHRQFKFHAWFKFTSNHYQVRAIPREGHIVFGEKKKIKLVFRPLLSCDDVDKLAWDLKVQKIKEIMKLELEELEKSKKMGKKPSKAHNPKSPKTSVVEEPKEPQVDEDNIVLEEADIYPAEKALLETMEPYKFNVDVKCMVATAPSKAANAPRRIEIHKIRVKCSVVRPDFVIDCNSRKFCFGPVAVNTRPKQDLIVRNITVKDIPVSVNALDPEVSFYIPPEETIVAPEHSLTLPVVFGPTEECRKVS